MTRIAAFIRFMAGGLATLALATAAVGAPASKASVVEGDPPTRDASPVSLRPEADAGLTRSTEGLLLQIRPDGSRRVDLKGRFRAYSVVTIAADGALTMACADDHVSAIALARAMAPRPASPRAVFGPREE